MPRHSIIWALSPSLQKSTAKFAQLRTSERDTHEKLPHLLPSLDRQSETTIQHTSNTTQNSQPAIMPSVELMTTETFNLGEAAVGVADIFEGTNPPVEFLKKRAGDMLRAKPPPGPVADFSRTNGDE